MVKVMKIKLNMTEQKTNYAHTKEIWSVHYEHGGRYDRACNNEIMGEIMPADQVIIEDVWKTDDLYPPR